MIREYDYIILGAGPSGLSFANRLLQHGVRHSDILVIEKEASVGGLCRSTEVDGSPLDIGGGHFLDVKNTEVVEFLFGFLPSDEWMRYSRISHINYQNMEIDYPFESNLWQLPIDTQVRFLESIANAGCLIGHPMPLVFPDWIRWKLGNQIAEEYMLPYNEKIWSCDLNTLGTYWLYKLPDVSFRETLRSCIERQPIGKMPAHSSFLYPKRYGYGEVWRRMGEVLGESLVTDCSVESIDLTTLTVNGKWKAKKIISTIPWHYYSDVADLDSEVILAVKNLKHASIDVEYYPTTLETKAHWVYEPDLSILHHRVLVRSNFCNEAKGYWTETNSMRSSALGEGRLRFSNEYSYPLNTIDKPTTIEYVTAWFCKKNIIGLGRWGRWEHMNSDVAVWEALKLADKLIGKA